MSFLLLASSAQAYVSILQCSSSATVDKGTQLSLYVRTSTNTNEAPGYQWFRNNSALTGETGPTLIRPSAADSDSGTYRCLITAKAGELTTPDMIVQVVSRAPQPISPFPRSDIPASALWIENNFSGARPMTYQWQRNGQPLTGETNPYLVLSTNDSSRAGVYRLQATNSHGSALSAPVNVLPYDASAERPPSYKGVNYATLVNAQTPVAGRPGLSLSFYKNVQFYDGGFQFLARSSQYTGPLFAYRWSQGQVFPLVDSQTPDSTGGTITGVESISRESGGVIWLKASSTTPAASTGAFYRWSNGTLTRVATSGQPAPGGGTYQWLDRICGEGEAAFWLASVDPGNGSGSNYRIYRRTASGTTLLLDNTAVFPGSVPLSALSIQDMRGDAQGFTLKTDLGLFSVDANGLISAFGPGSPLPGTDATVGFVGYWDRSFGTEAFGLFASGLGDRTLVRSAGYQNLAQFGGGEAKVTVCGPRLVVADWSLWNNGTVSPLFSYAPGQRNEPNIGGWVYGTHSIDVRGDDVVMVVDILDELFFSIAASWHSDSGAPPAFAIPSLPARYAARVGLDYRLSANPVFAQSLQWKKGPANRDGATAATLDFTPFTADDAGTYTLAATNSITTTTSAPAVIEAYDEAPAIVLEIQDQTVLSSSTLVLEPKFFNGSKPVLWQWFRNGEALPNPEWMSALNPPILERPGISVSDSGSYQLVGTWNGGSVSTRAIQVNVIPYLETVSDWKLWQDTNFGPTAALSTTGDEADPDGDGLSNLIEYSFGLNPNTASVLNLQTGVSPDGQLSFVFRQRTNDLSLNYTVETGPNPNALTTYTGWTTDEHLEEGDGYRLIRRWIPLPVGAESGFIRLRIVRRVTPW